MQDRRDQSNFDSSHLIVFTVFRQGTFMISTGLPPPPPRRKIHYGWVMVGVTFLTALISAGAVGAPGVFIVPLQKEFGWSTAEISSALSVRFALFGLIAPFAA